MSEQYYCPGCHAESTGFINRDGIDVPHNCGKTNTRYIGISPLKMLAPAIQNIISAEAAMMPNRFRPGSYQRKGFNDMVHEYGSIRLGTDGRFDVIDTRESAGPCQLRIVDGQLKYPGIDADGDDMSLVLGDKPEDFVYNILKGRNVGNYAANAPTPRFELGHSIAIPEVRVEKVTAADVERLAKQYGLSDKETTDLISQYVAAAKHQVLVEDSEVFTGLTPARFNPEVPEKGQYRILREGDCEEIDKVVIPPLKPIKL